MGSEVESGKGEFVEALEDPTCLLQWKRLAEEEGLEHICTHLGGCKLLSLFAFFLFPLGLETFEVTSAHILRGTLGNFLTCFSLCCDFSLESIHGGDQTRVTDRLDFA